MDDQSQTADRWQPGLSLEVIKRLTAAWESGHSLDDVRGHGAQAAGGRAPEQPVRLNPIQFARLFSGQKITPRNIQRAVRLGLVSIDGVTIVVKSPKFLRIGIELTRLGIGVDEILDEFEELQTVTDTIAARFTKVFEHNMWDPFAAAGLPADQVGQLTESLQRLSAVAEDVVQNALRDALRRQAGDFLAAQASRFDDAKTRAELTALARAAGFSA
jgi:hypothetical protein